MATPLTNPSPINVDRVIQDIQQGLVSGLPWLTAAYGRAWKAYGKQMDGKSQVTFPEAYNGSGQYVNMLPNDLEAAYCFFYVRDKAEPVEYQPNIHNTYRQPVDLIFWYDLTAIFPAIDYVLTENVIARIRAILSQFSEVSINSIFTEPANIFTGFTLSEVETQFIRHPYGGFRIAMDVQYLESFNETECQ